MWPVQMDRRGLAEMSCIAGVGGDVPKRKLRAQARPITGWMAARWNA